MIIVTYDEHGGFFDHVSPPSMVTKAPNGEYEDFQSLGVRVPALIISPFVEKGTTFHGQLDHTSILKFIGQVFGGGSYTPDVDQRGVGSVWDVLNVPNRMRLLRQHRRTSLIIWHGRSSQQATHPESQPITRVPNRSKLLWTKCKTRCQLRPQQSFQSYKGRYLVRKESYENQI